MVAAWIKALLFVGGGVTAAAGTAYVTGLLDPWLATPPQTLAALPGEPSPAPGEQTPPAAAPAIPLPEDPQTTEKQDRLQPPTFDLLRVEPDGSVVIAGKASPGAAIEVLGGERVLATADATQEGDFVAVFEERLAPGDYQLSLRATRQDEVVLSTETAIVSIPETAGGQVLAMIEEPGKPAEVVTAPAAPATPGPAPAGERPADVAAAPAGEPAATEEQPADVAAAPIEETPAGEPAATKEQLAEIAAAPVEEAPAGEPASTEEQPADVAAAPAGEAPAGAPAATEEQPADVAAAPIEETPAGEPAATEEQPADVAAAPVEETPAGEPDATEQQPADTAAAPAGEQPAGEQEIAAAPPAPEEEPAAFAPPAIVHSVAVEAVEIEGETVFIAGSATPGLAVRVYANALHLGDSKVSAGGRFLVEARRDLPVGDYLIRADLLEADGTVIARAAVPFEREPGESVAAVAPPPAAAPGPAPAGEEVAAAPADNEQDAAAAPDQPAPPAAPVEEAAAAAPPAQPERPAAPVVTIEAVEETPADDQPAGVAEEPAGDEVEIAAAAPPAAAPPAAPPAAGVPEVTAPKLLPARGAVIIRRGDNLWRISRRVYGKGVRYSTIYLANQDQISDPDRIWPGQVFGVPQTTPEGEDADLEAMGDQMVPPDTESKIIR